MRLLLHDSMTEYGERKKERDTWIRLEEIYFTKVIHLSRATVTCSRLLKQVLDHNTIKDNTHPLFTPTIPWAWLALATQWTISTLETVTG